MGFQAGGHVGFLAGGNMGFQAWGHMGFQAGRDMGFQDGRDMGFQAGGRTWISKLGGSWWGSRDATSLIVVALTVSGTAQSCAQPSPELREHTETQRLKQKSLLCLAQPNQRPCRCAELPPTVKEDETAQSHLEIPQPLHMVTPDKDGREMGSVSRLRVTLLLHGSTKSGFCNQ